MEAETHIVAITDLGENAEAKVGGLATVLGITAYEARQRVQPPTPRVAATLVDAGAAARLAEALEGAGFPAAVLRRRDIEGEETRILVRSFEFHPAGLRVETRSGERHAIRFDRIRLLLQGTDFQRGVETKTSTRRKFAPAKALISGGMAMTKKVKTRATTVHESGGPFLLVSGEALPTLAFREDELQYQGLGSALQPGRAANFMRLVSELRDHAGAARWSGQLMTAAGQRHVLGGALSPDRDLDVAIALLTHRAAKRGCAEAPALMY